MQILPPFVYLFSTHNTSWTVSVRLFWTLILDVLTCHSASVPFLGKRRTRKPWKPLQLQMACWLPAFFILVVMAVGLEVGLHFSNKSQGIPSVKFAALHFSQTLTTRVAYESEVEVRVRGLAVRICGSTTQCFWMRTNSLYIANARHNYFNDGRGFLGEH